MNALSRAFLAIYSLIWIGACAGVGVLLWKDAEMLDLSVRGLTMRAFFEVKDASVERGLLTALLVLLAMIGLITLVLAFMRPGPAKGTLRMRQQDGGVVEVTTTAIQSLLESELGKLPEVRQASVRVKLTGGAVDTDVTASIEPSASIANVTTAVGQMTAQVLKEQVGVTAVRRPVVRIRYDEIAARPVPVERRGAAPSAPVPPPPVPPPAVPPPGGDAPSNE